MIIGALPYVLSVFSLITMVTIWLARKAILQGNWLKHRHLMVASLALWGLTLVLFAFYLWVRGLIVIVAVPEVLFGLYVISVSITAALLVDLLLKVARHQFHPHKLLARKVIFVWLWTCLLSMLFYPLTDAHFYSI